MCLSLVAISKEVKRCVYLQIARIESSIFATLEKRTIGKFNKDAQYPAPKRSAPVQLHWTFAK
jgi:hypothetical protein